jgi:lipid-binding SYLF domain-containing protein
MISNPRTEQRGVLRSGVALIAAAAIAGALVPGTGASQEYKTGAQIYGMPKSEPVRAKKIDIEVVDVQAQALVDQLRAGSPTAVDYADRAYGALIFPDIETESRLVLGETNALGVLYVKDSAGDFQKHGYYQGRRNSLGFGIGESSSSRIFMFMTEEALREFLEGEISATYMRVDAETGEVSGETDADIAAFITNVDGDLSDLSFKGLFIAPVEIVN